MVDIYEKDESGRYQLVQNDIEFYYFLTEILKFEVIKMTQKNQENYGNFLNSIIHSYNFKGINFLNIGDGHLICQDKESARKIAKHKSVTG